MIAQSATAHTRREPGRSSVRQPAVRMSVRGTRGRQDSGAFHTVGHQGRTAANNPEFLFTPGKKNTFIKVYNPCTEYLFIYVLSYL